MLYWFDGFTILMMVLGTVMLYWVARVIAYLDDRYLEKFREEED